MSNRVQAKTEVLQGTLDLMVLQTVATLGSLHGYAIAARLEQVSGGALRLNMGTLYPVSCAWNSADSCARRGPSRTAIGRRGSMRLLRQDGADSRPRRAEWDRMTSIMHTSSRAKDNQT